MKWWPGEARTGDMIRIKSGSVYHYGIFADENEVIQFGMPPETLSELVSSADIEVCVTDIDTFAHGGIVEVGVPDMKEKHDRFSPEKTVENARSRIGEKGYNILHNNCEHFVWQCMFGEGRCTAVEEARKRWKAIADKKNGENK